MAIFARGLAILLACLSITTYLIFPDPYSRKEVLELKAQLTALIPKTAEEIELKIASLQEHFLSSIELLDKAFLAKSDFASTLQPWINIGQELLENLSTLSCLPLLAHDDNALVGKFYGAVQGLEVFIHDKIHEDKQFIQGLLVYTDDAKLKTLNSYESYYLQQIVSKLCHDHFYTNEADMINLLQLQMKLSKVSTEPFQYLLGEASELKEIKPNLKLFTVNTCLMPGGLSFFYGGVKRWEERIEGIIQKIQGLDADVICLQEVHSEAAAARLFQALKGKYAHFYINMGPRVFGTSLQDLGLNSGLFVASKYPLENPHFEEFSIVGKQQEVNKGFFFATISCQGRIVAHLVTCHLEPFNAAHCSEIREKELVQIVEYVKSKDPQNTELFFLCGDLNIPWGVRESGESFIENHFQDAFNQSRTKIHLSDRTCTDYFTRCVMAKPADLPVKGEGSRDILDYVLLFKNESMKHVSMRTKLVPFFDTRHPSGALSDHNGLLSEIKLSK